MKLSTREALELAIKELEDIAEFVGAEGWFTRAKHILIDVIPALSEAMEET